jgi:hypothetical protein
MENMVELMLNAENVRILVLLAFGFCGFIWIKNALSKEFDEKLINFHSHLKTNDFAHLNNTIEALTFMLEKNEFLTREDKEYIDGRLDK